MIPRRQGIADINLTIPAGNGQLPPIPSDAIGDAPKFDSIVTPTNAPVAPSTSRSGQILDALVAFSKVAKKDTVQEGLLKQLTEKKLIVVAGDYAVVSEKGLKYLIDFTL